ncbi:helix-turn-helix transcriptional regulator [Bacillus sp. XF8]|uniref:helix-turn-helix domain-containing protein n=1 Tax=Bacillus sp. XF8 TaxID=2819289 RepID=UPI001AA051ED|nr:helix-turn-helix transcriptional regulator [Bacillus sp. XF8]MBO1579369.1 helix-turn-helix transcriptional regulator [Bacillus sp. XF8]
MTIKVYFDLVSIYEKYRTNPSDLSRRTGIDRSYLYGIQKNQSISLKNLARIAAGLNVEDPTKLLTVEVNKK